MKQKGGSGIEKRMVRQYLVLSLYFCLSGIPLQTGTV